MKRILAGGGVGTAAGLPPVLAHAPWWAVLILVLVGLLVLLVIGFVFLASVRMTYRQIQELAEWAYPGSFKGPWGIELKASAEPATAPRRVDHTGVWTGSVLLVWGGRTLRGDSWVTPPHGLVHDPASNRWSDLPVSPLRGRIGHVAAWTGSQLLIWGVHSVTGPDKDFTDGAACTPPPV